MPLKKKKKVTKKTVKRAVRKAVKKKVNKRKVVRKAVKKAAVAVKQKDVIGIVTHYFSKIRVAVVKLKGPLALGDMIKIKGHTTDFKQTVTSMQFDHVSLNTAKKGQEVGMLVNSRVRQHDVVYKEKGLSK